MSEERKQDRLQPPVDAFVNSREAKSRVYTNPRFAVGNIEKELCLYGQIRIHARSYTTDPFSQAIPCRFCGCAPHDRNYRRSVRSGSWRQRLHLICLSVIIGYMKVFAISDLHLDSTCEKPMNVFGPGWEGHWEKICSDWKERVADEDVVLLAGDLSWAMTLEAAAPDLADIGSLPGRKYILRGNHDYWWSAIGKVRDALPQGMYAVQNDCLRCGSLLICGSRLWSVNPQAEEDKKIAAREYIRLEMSLKAMRAQRQDGDKVAVMTHYPPFDASFADSVFTDLIAEYAPDAVIYGHLHGKDVRVRPVVDKKGVKYYLTSCDLVGHRLVEIFGAV